MRKTPREKNQLCQKKTPLHIEKPSSNITLRPPKATIKRERHNPNARVAQNYSTVKDLTQAPCAMSTLEVLQGCPTQCKALLEILTLMIQILSCLISITISLVFLIMLLFRSMLNTKDLSFGGQRLMKEHPHV